MNQPYQPGNPYGHDPYPNEPYGQADPYAQQYDVAYPAQQPYQAQQPAQYAGPGQQPPKKSNLPMFIAAGLVVALAIGLTLFFVLRDDSKETAGGDPSSLPTSKEVTESFFKAVDAKDEDKMRKLGRGDVEGDIDNIMDADTTAVKFGDGKVIDSALKKVDGIRLAVVTWLVNDPPDGQEDDAELAVALLDDGDGFQICKIDGSDGDSANETMSNFETDYESDCEYSK